MDKEVSSFIELGVSLMALSVAVGVIMSTVLFGNSIKNDGISYLVGINHEISNSFLTSLDSTNEILPSAAAFNIIKSYANSIEKTDCKICDTVITGYNDNPCVISHLKGEVSLGVVKNKSMLFDVYIHKPDCTWFTNNCTCY